MEVREVDGAGVEVDEGHGNALSLQGGKLVDVHPAELESVGEGVWLRATETESKVLRAEHGDLLLLGQREEERRHDGECARGQQKTRNPVI